MVNLLEVAILSLKLTYHNDNHPTLELTQLIETAHNILVFSGAGISTESGISDYRSKGGLWQRFQPVTIQEFLSSREKRVEYWKTKTELYERLGTARPNAGHQAIKRLEETGRLTAIVTQNIDGLHQVAGNSSEKIIELHGNNRETVCLSCGDITSWEETFERLKGGDAAPLCLKCEGFLKPRTISFGQSLEADKIDRAFQFAHQCDLVLAVGSTLLVEPAASIPRVAKGNGAKLVIITLSETPLDDLADLKIESSAGQCLSAAVK